MAGVGSIGVPLASELPQGIDAVIDFSVPQGTAAILAQCVARKLPLVVATTGLAADVQDRIRAASKQIPTLWAPNMSLAVNLAMKLAEMAARALKDHPSGADVEIIESHHRYKEDAPSGTALKFGEIIAAVMGQAQHRHGRSGRPGKRPHGEIGYHALRTGDNPGEHTIVFGLLETLLTADRVQAGELTMDKGFQPWPVTPEQALARIGAGWDQLNREPDIGDVAWFTALPGSSASPSGNSAGTQQGHG